MRIWVATLLLLQAVVAGAASACHLERPEMPVILTIDGLITGCNAGLEAHFDIAMLEAMPKTVVKTSNPWEPGEATYEGVLLSDLMIAVEASGTVLTIAALNDYRADIPVADLAPTGAILAYKRNGAYMPVREKGPLFVVFPFSTHPTLAVEARFGQSVWQVARITVK
jgi:hypothetical protein